MLHYDWLGPIIALYTTNMEVMMLYRALFGTIL